MSRILQQIYKSRIPSRHMVRAYQLVPGGGICPKTYWPSVVDGNAIERRSLQYRPELGQDEFTVAGIGKIYVDGTVIGINRWLEGNYFAATSMQTPG